jgi:hypothetical protein
MYLIDISTISVILVGMICRRYTSLRYASLVGIYLNWVSG